MANVSNIVKSIQDIMRKDAGTYGDAQRLEQLGWMFFLKIFDDREKELELIRGWRTRVMSEHGLRMPHSSVATSRNVITRSRPPARRHYNNRLKRRSGFSNP